MAPTVYKEYLSLMDTYKATVSRLNSLAENIGSEGVNIPNLEEVDPNDIANVVATVREYMYPEDGTWGDKILYVLRALKEPSHAITIIEAIKAHQKIHSMNMGSVADIVSATCSRMAKEGVIGLDNSQKKNIYYLL